MITQQTHDEMFRIANLNRFTSHDAREMERLIRTTFNPKYSVCPSCPQQIKHGQKQILNFLAQTQILSPEEEILFPSTPEVEVDEVEADKAGCSKCKRKVKTTK
jgi:hypothetical protein